MVKQLIIGVFFLLISLSGYCQKKYEREFRIDVADVPKVSIDFVMIECLDGAKLKVKWYREEGLETKTIEAKFRYNQLWYSIEFNKDGELEDIERIVRYRNTTKEFRERLAENLNKDFSAWRVEKIQEQFTGTEESLSATFKKGEPTEGTTLRYELVVSGEGSDGMGYYEILARPDGKILKISKFVHRTSENIIY